MSNQSGFEEKSLPEYQKIKSIRSSGIWTRFWYISSKYLFPWSEFSAERLPRRSFRFGIVFLLEDAM